MSISILTIFLAGFITILSPCILPILPPFLAASIKQNKWKPIYITLGLMSGFTVVGVGISYFGQSLGLNTSQFRIIAIILLFLIGLALALPKYSSIILGRLEYYLNKFSYKSNLATSSSTNAISGYVTGLGLGFAWIPCIGPVYGAVLAFASSRESFGLSVFYFVIYLLGAALPMLLLAFFGNRLLNKFKIAVGTIERIKIIAGLILIAVAIGMVMGWDETVQIFILQYYPNFAL